ncbi:MAG: NUDIX domain-containing protein [Candidatus Spechtbacterales bacterium]|nr:NUDIX domain-containing protein [Candidatus Spechtbacterales bacterium]
MAHIHEKIDYAAMAYIVFEDRVLLIHHRELDMWLPVGGHVELDEDPQKALFREIEEESGLKQQDIEILAERPGIKVADRRFLYTPAYLDIHPITEEHEHVGFIYFARTKNKEVILNEAEHHEIKWFSAEDLENGKYNVAEGVKFYSRKALERAAI